MFNQEQNLVVWQLANNLKINEWLSVIQQPRNKVLIIIFKPNQNTSHLDVHHHLKTTSSNTPFKKWTNYFWEFLMLFLAVFCGFLAEYQLEQGK